MGVEIEFVLFGYDGLYDALLIDRCDILISALIIDETKTKEFAYSDPYFNAGQFIVTHESNRSIKSLADLEGQTVAVETGSAGHVEAISAQNRVRNSSPSIRVWGGHNSKHNHARIPGKD